MRQVKKGYFLTIGQAPRQDIAISFRTYFEKWPNVVQIGLLDGLTDEQIQELYGKTDAAQHTLTTLLQDGRAVVMDHEKVEAGLQAMIDQLEEALFVCILCTGSFEKLHVHKGKLLRADEVVTEKYRDHRQLGFLVPLAEQITDSQQKWQAVDAGLFQPVSPYHFSEKEAQAAVEQLRQKQVKTVIMDCIGFNRTEKEVLEKMAAEIQFVLANEVIFRQAEEMMKREEE